MIIYAIRLSIPPWRWGILLYNCLSFRIYVHLPQLTVCIQPIIGDSFKDNIHTLVASSIDFKLGTLIHISMNMIPISGQVNIINTISRLKICRDLFTKKNNIFVTCTTLDGLCEVILVVPILKFLRAQISQGYPRLSNCNYKTISLGKNRKWTGNLVDRIWEMTQYISVLYTLLIVIMKLILCAINHLNHF